MITFLYVTAHTAVDHNGHPEAKECDYLTFYWQEKKKSNAQI